MEPTFGAIVGLEIPSHGKRIRKPWMLRSEIRYYSERYSKWVIVPVGYKSDGATGAIDLKGTVAWWVHDWLCDHGVWADGAPVTNWQASRVITDILDQDEYDVRRWVWFWPTWLFGGGKCRANMW
jgi:hypothetical protein